MLNCKKITELCSREMDDPLRSGELLAMHTHLLVCSGCRHFRQQVQMMRTVAGAYAGGNALSTSKMTK